MLTTKRKLNKCLPKKTIKTTYTFFVYYSGHFTEEKIDQLVGKENNGHSLFDDTQDISYSFTKYNEAIQAYQKIKKYCEVKRISK